MRLTKVHWQDATKLAISLVLFYWLALAANWELAHYGALAIVLIGMNATDASLKKGLLRVAGTAVGVIVGLSVLALFAQDRWTGMLFFSGYLVLVSYFMLASRYAYAWFVAGFVPTVVWGDTYMNAHNAFYFGTYRFLETAAGVAIYTMVAMILWPRLTPPVNGPTGDAKTAIRSLATWDTDRFMQALFPGFCFAVAFVFWVVCDPPTGQKIPMMAGILGLMMLLTKAKPIPMLLLLLGSTIFAVAPVYLFVMPHLTAGPELLLLVFIYACTFSLLGSRWPSVKTMPLVAFVMTVDISNQQTYSFMGIVNAVMMYLLAQGLVTLVYLLRFPDQTAESATHLAASSSRS